MDQNHELGANNKICLDNKLSQIYFDAYINNETQKDGETPKWTIKTGIEFKTSYWDRFSPKQQWIINNHIVNMRHTDSITSFGKSSQCPTLKLPNHENYYSIEMDDDGIGHNQVKLTIFVDGNIIWILDGVLL